MSVKTIKGNLLFWKISGVFTLLIIILGVAYIIIASRVSRNYFNEVHEQLYGGIAAHLATSTHPFKNGKPDTSVTHDIIHSIMVINPSMEVYLLDSAGRIVDFTVPENTVKKRVVDLFTINQFITSHGKKIITGDNPREPYNKTIFSAAPVYQNGKISGYVYVVLASEKQKEILTVSNNHFYYSLGSSIFFATLFVAFVVGIITFFLITDSVCKIAGVVKSFKEGNYDARITGNSKGNLGVLTSTFNEMAEVIVNNIEKIKATDKLRQELIANVSHDLRTPLSIMRGYIETIIIKKDSLPDVEQRRYLQIVLDGSVKLSKLVEQLFQYSRLEANEVQVKKEKFLLDELAADIFTKYKLLTEGKNIDLKFKCSPNLPPVYADIGLTERVIQNLLDNALKFTNDNGSITIKLENSVMGVKIYVADTGIGIPTNEQVHIFDRYKQLSDSKIFGKGMGLGLAIVKKILIFIR